MKQMWSTIGFRNWVLLLICFSFFHVLLVILWNSVDGGLCVGVRCEIASCDWLDGRPKLGHLQEAARDMRSDILSSVF